MMINDKCPCKNCGERTWDCRISCKDYKAWRAEYDAWKSEKVKQAKKDQLSLEFTLDRISKQNKDKLIRKRNKK